jgi:exodeoxyribonuclease-3
MTVFKVATFNTNSIRARIPVITDWLERERPDILCLQETKVQDKDFPAGVFEEQGYKVAYRGQKSYNGVAMVGQHPMVDIRHSLYGEEGEEARFISARIRGLPVVGVYVPQGFAPGTEKFAYKLQWLRDLLALLGGEYRPEAPLLVMGDFNVALEPNDVYDPEGLRGEVGFHPEEQTLFREYLAWGLVDVFRRHHSEGGHYTFWDYRIPNALKRNMGWRIDYILATRPLAERSHRAWIDRDARAGAKPSDHTFLAVEFELE